MNILGEAIAYIMYDPIIIWRFILLMLGIILLFMQPEGATLITGMLGAYAVILVIDQLEQTFHILKTMLPGGGGALGYTFFMVLLRVWIFVCPVMVFGLSKSEKARGLALLTMFLAVPYVFTMWFFTVRKISIHLGPPPSFMRDAAWLPVYSAWLHLKGWLAG